ncbi:hypothetical protein L208DRAFT_1328157 [Tricholoma matsutake]|nr:hypothetical protein L208DRAFT_1328157 [Tricholoma matsutake 945]
MYGLPQKTILSWLVSWAQGCDVKGANINLPTVVIGPGNDEIGECWEFTGGAGSIHLPERMYISVSSSIMFHPSFQPQWHEKHHEICHCGAW